MHVYWRGLARAAPVVGVVAFLSCAVVLAQQGVTTYEQISVLGTAVGIATTTTNPAGRAQMNTCEVRVEGATVRFREDGTDPTASVGSPFLTTETLTISTNARARAFRFIRSAGNAIITVRCAP